MGEDPSSLLLELGPQMGGVSSAMGSALKAQEGDKNYGSITTEDLGGGYKAAYRAGSPGMHVIAPPKSHEITPSALAALAKAIPDLQQSVRLAGTNAPNSAAQKVLDKIMPLLDQGSTATKSKPRPGTVPPVSQREVGKVYSTPKGDFEWTGKGWRKQAAPVQEAPVDNSSDDGEE
jgi:hypothetical protein